MLRRRQAETSLHQLKCFYAVTFRLLYVSLIDSTSLNLFDISLNYFTFLQRFRISFHVMLVGLFVPLAPGQA